MVMSVFMIVGAILVLYFGAEFSLDASEKVGKRLGLSPLVIGMLLVGFGTSLPEFFVGHIAGLQGKAGIAIGSLIGSNIANMFLILGISGLICFVGVQSKGIRRHLNVHLILAIAITFILFQPVLNIFTGGVLLAVCVLYLYIIYLDMITEKRDERMRKEISGDSIKDEDLGEDSEDEEDNANPGVLVIKLIAGFSLLYLGGELLVKGATDLCTALGMSEYIISAIFIAFGTSFPELVTVLLASIKKKDTDLILGNIIGSNMFNCAFILGSLGIYNFNISGSYNFEITALFFGAIYLLGLNLLKKDFGKLSGVIFLLGYGVMVGHWMKAY